MEFIKIAKIINTHGIKGDLKLNVYTDFIEERFKKGSTIYVGEKHIEEKVDSYRFHKNALLLKLQGKGDINLVEKYKNMDIYKSSEDIKELDEGYYFSDLKDLDVYCENVFVGKVLYMEEGVTCNYLRVKTNDNEVLIPYIENVFVEKVDLDNKRIDIKKMEGLL